MARGFGLQATWGAEGSRRVSLAFVVAAALGPAACTDGAEHAKADADGGVAPPSICGDGIVNGWEECDGAADQACPGSCSRHCACPAAPAGGDLQIHLIDVGEGDAILLISPDGFVMLVDAGDAGQAGTVTGYLRQHGVLELDYVLASHPHADHLGGMDLMLADHPETVACFDNGGTADTGQFREYAVAAGSRRTTLVAGDTLDLGPSVEAEVLHADPGSGNDSSVVLKLTYGKNTFLLGGDCEGTCETEIAPGHVDVYKVHHHGSSAASSNAFLDKITPRTALVSAGGDGGPAAPHGSNPDAVTLKKLQDHGADTYCTWQSDSIVVVADGEDYSVTGRRCATVEP